MTQRPEHGFLRVLTYAILTCLMVFLDLNILNRKESSQFQIKWANQDVRSKWPQKIMVKTKRVTAVH